MEELEQLVETAKRAVPGVEAAIAAAVDRKVNPVSQRRLSCLYDANANLQMPVCVCGYCACAKSCCIVLISKSEICVVLCLAD